MTRYHKISIDHATFTALQKRATAIQKLLNRPVSVAMLIRLLATYELHLKENITPQRTGK